MSSLRIAKNDNKDDVIYTSSETKVIRKCLYDKCEALEWKSLSSSDYLYLDTLLMITYIWTHLWIHIGSVLYRSNPK